MVAKATGVLLEKKVYEAKITSKGQIVIPKPVRDAYGLREGMKLKLVMIEGGVLLKPSLDRPWSGLKGMMKKEWVNADLDSLIEEAKRTVFKAPNVSR